MLRTLLRVFAVLVLAGAALTVRTDAINVADLNAYFSSGGATTDRIPFVPPPSEGMPEPAMMLVFGLALSIAAWRVRRAGGGA